MGAMTMVFWAGGVRQTLTVTGQAAGDNAPGDLLQPRRAGLLGAGGRGGDAVP